MEKTRVSAAEVVAVGGGRDHVSAATEERRMKIKVVVAIDDSDGSFYALKWALDNILSCLVSKTPGTKVDDDVGMVFLINDQPRSHGYAYPVGPSSADARYTTSSLGLGEKVNEQEEQKARGVLSQALQNCRQKMVKAEMNILVGDAKEMICEAAEQLHADLLIVGSNRKGMLERIFLGSVSEYCAHHAKVSTLVVKQPPKESKKD